MIVIPAIDIIGGKCVRLTQGDYRSETRYEHEPLEFARGLESAGFTHLHVVDLDGARLRRPVNTDAIAQICSGTRLRVDAGGGISNTRHLESLFAAGVAQVNIGSLAMREPETLLGWLLRFGTEKFILSADVRDMRIAVNGWEKNSGMLIHDFIKLFEGKIQYVTSTDISRDGMMNGPALTLYSELRETFPDLKLIASGGVSPPDDLAALVQTGVYGVIIGKALHERTIPAEEILKYHTPC